MTRAIAIAMIVKDESAHLAHCLESAQPIADEICVVDTGSQDDTVAIARRFGAQVEPFAWCDDFAAARNASIRLCTSEWVFVLDADERLAPTDLPAIRTLAQGPLDCCYRMVTRNYTNAATVSEFRPCLPDDPHAAGFAGWFPSWKVRLFPNLPGARYAGPVHELVRPSLEANGCRVLDSGVAIHHYPLCRDPARIQAKHRLYLQLGLAKARAHPEDPVAHAELGHQYADVGDYAGAIACYQESLRLAPRNAPVLKDLGGMLHFLGRDDAAKKSLELAVEYDPGLVEAWRNLGVVHAEQEAWQEAADCFGRTVELAPQWADGPRYLSLALDHLGRLTDAAEASRAAIEADPRSVEAVTLYVDQMARLGRPAEARALLERTIGHDLSQVVPPETLEKLGSQDLPEN